MFRVGIVGRADGADGDVADFSVGHITTVTAPLRRQQLRLLLLLAQRLDADGFWPSVDELAARLGLSRSTTCFHLRQLRAKGYLTRGSGVKTYRLTDLHRIDAGQHVDTRS